MKKHSLFRLMKMALLYFLLSCLTLVIIEGAVKVFYPQNSFLIRIKGKSYAIRDTELGHALTPDSHFIEAIPEFKVEYRINSEGLRDENEYSAIMKRNIRVLLLGDSMTIGAGVPYDDIWPVVAERELLKRGFDIALIKAGVPGYDQRQEVLYLKRLFPKYIPTMVFIVFLPNDLFTNWLPESSLPAPPQAVFFQDGGDRISFFHSINLFKRVLLRSDFLYTWIYCISARCQYYHDKKNSFVLQQAQITRKLLLMAAEYSRSKGVPFGVFSLPQQFQVLMQANGYKKSNVNVNWFDEEFSSFASENKFSWVSALPAMTSFYKEKGRDLYFRLDGHINSEGSRLVGLHFAEELEKLLKENSARGRSSFFIPAESMSSRSFGTGMIGMRIPRRPQ